MRSGPHKVGSPAVILASFAFGTGALVGPTLSNGCRGSMDAITAGNSLDNRLARLDVSYLESPQFQYFLKYRADKHGSLETVLTEVTIHVLLRELNRFSSIDNPVLMQFPEDQRGSVGARLIATPPLGFTTEYRGDISLDQWSRAAYSYLRQSTNRQGNILEILAAKRGIPFHKADHPLAFLNQEHDEALDALRQLIRARVNSILQK